MKKIIFSIVLLNFYFLDSFAQAPQKIWDSFFNGALNGKNESNSVITDNAGNVYVTGISYQGSSAGNFTTVKYNSTGMQQWADHFSISGTGTSNKGVKIVLDKWQNLYAIGTVASNSGDIAVVKYNSSGKIWSHNYEPYSFGSDIDFGVDICVDTLGNFYATGQVTSLAGNLWDSYNIKCDSSGAKIFDENYSSGSGDDFPKGVAVTPGGNFFALTNSYNFFGSQTYDIFTINYLANGNQNWISRYNGVGNGFDYGTFFKTDDANNQYVCGTAFSGTNDDMVVMKQNQYGTRLWVTPYNGTANGNDTAVSTTWLPNGFVVVTGKSKEILNSTVVDAFVTMVIDSGTVVWTNKFYGIDSLGAVPSQMVTDAQGNIYICGFENLIGGTKNGCIIKYGSNGNLLWNISYDAGLSFNDKFNSIALDFNNDILVTGQTFTSSTNANYVTVKYGNGATGVNENLYPGLNESIIYPNPVKTGTVLHVITGKETSSVPFSISDLSGRIIQKGIIDNDLIGLNNQIVSGIYILEFKANKSTIHKQILVSE